MLKKIVRIVFIFLLLITLTAISILTALNLFISSNKTKTFVAGHLARVAHSKGISDVLIGNLKLSFYNKFPALIIKDVKIYTKPSQKSTGASSEQPRQLIFNCDTIILIPDYRYLLIRKGQHPLKQISIRGGNLDFPSEKISIKNLNLTITGISRGMLSSSYTAPIEPPHIKTDFTLIYDKKFYWDISSQDGVFDFASMTLSSNNIKATLSESNLEITDINGVIKFNPDIKEGISNYHFSFKIGLNEVEKLFPNANDTLKILKMLKFTKSSDEKEQKFAITISKPSNTNQPQISITPINSKMQILVTY